MLVAVLNRKYVAKEDYVADPTTDADKLANIDLALAKLAEFASLHVDNVDASGIMNHDLKTILRLLYTLHRHYRD